MWHWPSDTTYTLHFTVYKPIHHNICQSSCRVNRIIYYKYLPVNDHRAVISHCCFPVPCSLSASHTYTQSSVSHPSHCSVRGSQFNDKAWHYRVDLSLLCLCEWDHDPSDLVINIPMAIQINAFTLVDCGQQSQMDAVYWSPFVIRGKLITWVAALFIFVWLLFFFFSFSLAYGAAVAEGNNNR